MAQTSLAKAQFPEKAKALFKPAPYKVVYGGRASSKTHSFCRALLTLAGRKKLFILCAREIQKSIKESVHKTLADLIDEMELGWFWTVQNAAIVGANGSRFVFAGIRNNINAIKSMEAIDICAVFEATFVSHHSWEVLLPTIRRDAPYGPFGKGSEIWIEFNPELVTDETYKRWVVEPPIGTVIVEMNWRDNPWFPQISRDQMLDLKARDYESYLNVWEGKTRKTLEGAIYAKEIATATREGRISPAFKADRGKPVHLSFDLGRSDTTCIWFWQQFGMEHYAVDYMEGVGHDFAHYVSEIQKKGYMLGKIYLPHDAEHHHQSAAKSISMQARDVWPTDGQVIVNPRIPNITLGINLVRSLFPRIKINEATCADGMMALQHYQYGVNIEKLDPKGRPERTAMPKENWACHAADSLRMYAEGLRDPERATAAPARTERPRREVSQGWMGI